MNQEDYLKFHEELCNKARNLSKSKQDDYASKEDCLSNFHLTARLMGKPTSDIILFRLTEKIVRLCNLHKNSDAVFEGIEDSIIDIVNLAILYRVNHKDSELLATRLIKEMEAEDVLLNEQPKPYFFDPRYPNYVPPNLCSDGSGPVVRRD